MEGRGRAGRATRAKVVSVRRPQMQLVSCRRGVRARHAGKWDDVMNSTQKCYQPAYMYSFFIFCFPAPAMTLLLPSRSAASATLLLLMLAFSGANGLSVVGRMRLKLGFGKSLREEAVARYFQGGMCLFVRHVLTISYISHCCQLGCIHLLTSIMSHSPFITDPCIVQ